MSSKNVLRTSFPIDRASTPGPLHPISPYIQFKKMCSSHRLGFFTALGFCLLTGSISAARDGVQYGKRERPGTAAEYDLGSSRSLTLPVLFQTEAKLLEPGKPIEGELINNASDSYLIRLEAGQFLNVSIEQRTMDLTASLFGPDEQQVRKFDSRWYGAEPVYFVAEAAGSYRLEIRSLRQTDIRGSYQVKIEELRAPGLQDQKRIDALKNSTEGKRLIDLGGKQSLQQAKEKYNEALPLWRD